MNLVLVFKHIILFSAVCVALIYPLYAQTEAEVPPAPVVVPDPIPVPTADIPAEPVRDAFKEALANVYANHPLLKAKREELAALDESVVQAVSGFRPDIGAGYSKGRERTASGGQDWSYRDTSAKTLDVTQQVFNGGETWASYKTAKDRVKAGRAELKDTEQQLLLGAVSAYTNLVEKLSVLELNQKNVDVLKTHLDATKTRFDVGELTKTDVAQAEARLSNAQAEERQALGDFEAARATFKRAIGFDAPDNAEMPIIPTVLPQTLNEAIDWAYANSPILEAAKFNENAATSNVEVRTASLLPDVNIQGTATRSRGSSVPSQNQFDEDALTLNVSIPLYQSGAEWSRIREAKNQASQAKFNTLDVQNAVVENVTRSWQDYHTSQAVIASTEQAINAAEIALEGVKQENQFGVRTVLDVLDAEQELFGSRVNLIRAKRAEKIYAYSLLATVGKLTAQDLGLPIQPYDPTEHYDNVKYQLIGF